MRVLVLDDLKVRHEYFKKRHGDDEVLHAYTHQAAADQLRDNARFDLVYLDHDLGTKATGYDTVKFILERMSVEQRPSVIVVHTVNEPCGRKMVYALHEAGVRVRYEPFLI